MTPAPGRALPLAAIVGLASPGCNVMFYAPLQLISDRVDDARQVVDGHGSKVELLRGEH